MRGYAGNSAHLCKPPFAVKCTALSRGDSGLGEVESQTDADEDGEAGIILIAQLLGLFLTFLGKATMLRLIEDLRSQVFVRTESPTTAANATDSVADGPEMAATFEDLLLEINRLRSVSEHIETLGAASLRGRWFVLNILDRFHIVAKMNDALDQVRADEARRMKQDGYLPVLRKSRWCLLKRKQNLTGRQKFRLRDLLQYNLKTVRAYLLKESFQQLWEYDSTAWAAKFLDAWCHQTMISRIEPMKKIARTIRKHRELILNYFRARKALSSGVVEGLNNKAKVTMRKSYGFRTFPVLELALYHSLAKLPEPSLTTISSDESYLPPAAPVAD
jgi:hypothetical protein